MMNKLILITFITFARATQFFPSGNPWNKDITSASVDPNSAAITQWLYNAGGWTGNTDSSNQGKFQSDAGADGIAITYTTTATTLVPMIQGDGYYSDCDDLSKFPYEPTGYIEGGLPVAPLPQGGDGGDDHYLVVDATNNILWESWQTSFASNGAMTSSCAIAWNMSVIYPNNGRGDECSSADAGGFPIAPLLPTADEVKAGVVNHALRFILPNNKMRAGAYSHPGSHRGSPSASATSMAPVYASHWRLKPDFDVTRLTSAQASGQMVAAGVIVKALQTYGMYLADGGGIPLSMADDELTTAKWGDLPFDSHSMFGIVPTDFDVLTMDLVTTDLDCVKNPLPYVPVGDPVLVSSNYATSTSTSSSVPSGSSASATTASIKPSTTASIKSSTNSASTSTSGSTSSGTTSKCTPSCTTGNSCYLGYCVCNNPAGNPTCLTYTAIGACGVQNACPTKTTCVDGQCMCVTQNAYVAFVAANTTFCEGASSPSSVTNSACTLSLPMSLAIFAAGIAMIFAH